MLNHQKIYQELLALVEEHSPIFVMNHIPYDDTFYRVFFYNYSTYAKFLLPSALECRGITFEVTENGDFIRLASMPMQKFFNYQENAFTQGIEDNTIDVAMFKEDGSLMSSLMHGEKIHLKSKGHLFSEQAQSANRVLAEKADLQDVIRLFENQNCTVNLEYTSPDNQIVLYYQEPSLTILNVRNRDTGEYIPYSDLKAMENVAPHLVSHYSQYEGMTLSEFADIVQGMEDIEGFVVQSNGQWIKLKTDWYCIRHNTIDVFNPFSKKGRRNLAEAVLNEETDDLKQIVESNDFLLNVIIDVENFFADYLENTERLLAQFKSENPNVERKDAFRIVNSMTKDGLQVRYIMNKAFSTDSEKEISLVDAIKLYIHGSKLDAYNDFISKIKNPDPEIYKES
jgi:T4 RnlA family RNA ligase